MGGMSAEFVLSLFVDPTVLVTRIPQQHMKEGIDISRVSSLSPE